MSSGDSATVSVVLPVYNAADTLQKCLDSLAGQECRDFEVVAIDDGSTDGSGDILRRAAKDLPMRILVNEQNIGLAASLNRAIATCASPWIARQDADDWSHPERLARQLDYMSTAPEAGFIGTAFAVTDEDGTVLTMTEPPGNPTVLRRVLRRRNLMAHGSVMFRRDLFDRTGQYREFFKLAQDYDLWLRLLDVSDPGMVSDVLYFHRLGGTTLGGTKKGRQEWYAGLARQCAALRATGVVDDIAQVGDEPMRPPWLADAQLVRAVCLLKGGQSRQARSQLLACLRTGRPTDRLAAAGLVLVSLAPRSLVEGLRRLRWRWDSR